MDDGDNVLSFPGFETPAPDADPAAADKMLDAELKSILAEFTRAAKAGEIDRVVILGMDAEGDVRSVISGRCLEDYQRTIGVMSIERQKFTRLMLESQDELF